MSDSMVCLGGAGCPPGDLAFEVGSRPYEERTPWGTVEAEVVVTLTREEAQEWFGLVVPDGLTHYRMPLSREMADRVKVRRFAQRVPRP